MTNKYKISELAKDFGMASKELIVIITNALGVEKKSGASLNEEEIGLVFDAVTKANSVKSFKEYFATGDAAREAAAKKREDDKNKMLADQMAILEQLKAAAAAQNAQNEPKKEEPKKE
ncbi:MAG: translation initiation factor IF-2 N-terminal domain-containing protein, partial [Acutalibacteraceae bacterium]|nr:translation initiation factor IF-2 N-terminal domain-containing protein [Acutalibacteraceae bacterium]